MMWVWKKGIFTGWMVLAASAWLGGHTPGRAGDAATLGEESPAADRLKPFFTEYCIACHGKEKQRGDVDLERLDPAAGLLPNRELWEKVRNALQAHEMPPEKRLQPPEIHRQAIVEQIDTALEKAEASLPSNPGVVTLRRLNRNEYRNTIRDLVGIDYDTSARLPTDESGYGFDNIGDVLSLPPMLLEKYLAAADDIAARVIVTEDPALKRVRKIRADQFVTQGDAISTVEEGTWGFYREGEISTEQSFGETGDYRLRLKAYGEQAGPELPKMAVRVDGREVHVQAVRAQAEKPEVFEIPLQIAAGSHRFAVAYLNNFNSDGDRNVFLASFEVVGPLGVPPEEYPEPHRRVLPRRPEKGKERSYAAEVMKAFATRAYRRPVRDDEVQRLVKFVDLALQNGETFEYGIQLAMQAVLVSPFFLYRWELDPVGLAPGATRDLNDYEVASRLSYFLWSSMPDDELLAVAAQGVLTKPDVLSTQVRRMLRDAKARALVQNFGGQWLQIRNLDQVEPDATVFPAWNPELREAMRRETEMFLWAIVQEDRGIREIIDSDFTYLNGPLARLYGIPGVEGAEFRRVSLPRESGRGGVLTMGSVLTVTSVPTRTSAVLRGKWILEQILGTPPPPPPPNVPRIDEGEEASKSASLRQRLEVHRSKPDCMACHQKMDPLGFALENFDGIGGWRESEGSHPIDNSAELPDGRKVQGWAGLKQVLVGSEEFPRAFTSKMLTYALGRGLESYDRRVVRQIVERLGKNDFKFSALVLEIAASEPFLKRQPEIQRHEQQASLIP